MAKAILLCKDGALDLFADPKSLFFPHLMKMMMRGENFVELSSSESEQMVERAFGKLRKNKPTYMIEFDRNLFTFADLKDLMDDANKLGPRLVEVLNFPTYLEIKANDYGNNVPEYVPESRIPVDPIDGVEQPDTVVTWDAWKHPNHTHHEVGNDFLIPLSSGTGKTCALSLAIQLEENGFDVDGWNRNVLPVDPAV